jgi:glycosyltransferase involved in cell wall biosynthesis
MRVLMLAQFYPPVIGGEERHVRNLSLALASRGHSVAVATIWQRGLQQFAMDGPIRVHRIRGTAQRAGLLFSESERRYAPPFPDPELLFRLRRIVLEEEVDIVHAHNWLLHSFLPLKRSQGPGLVVTLHDLSLVCSQKNAMCRGVPCSGPGVGKCLRCASDHYGMLKGGLTTVANWVSSAVERKLVDKFLAVSRAIVAGNRLEATHVPFEIVPNFVPDDVAMLRRDGDPRINLLPEQGFLLYVGDLRRLKGVHILLEAYAMLWNALPLVLIGRRCADTPRELPPNVIIFESWPHAAVMHAWSKCLFGITPSILPEACASVVIEAMAMGKPMIATAVGGTPELVDHGKTGLLVRSGDASALSEAMRRLIENPDLRGRMAAAAALKAKSLTASAVVPRIEQIYEEVVMRSLCSSGRAAKPSCNRVMQSMLPPEGKRSPDNSTGY